VNAFQKSAQVTNQRLVLQVLPNTGRVGAQPHDAQMTPAVDHHQVGEHLLHRKAHVGHIVAAPILHSADVMRMDIQKCIANSLSHILVGPLGLSRDDSKSDQVVMVVKVNLNRRLTIQKYVA
jgi:hypothetical protein